MRRAQCRDTVSAARSPHPPLLPLTHVGIYINFQQVSIVAVRNYSTDARAAQPAHVSSCLAQAGAGGSTTQRTDNAEGVDKQYMCRAEVDAARE